MLYDTAGVLVVFQMSGPYLATIVANQMGTDFPACLPTIGPVATGGVFVRSDAAVVSFAGSDARFDGSDVFIRLTLDREAGELAVGPDAASVAPVDQLTLEYPLRLTTDPAQPAELRVEIDLGSLPLPNPSFGLDLSDLRFGGVQPQLAPDPGRLKLLSDGTLAAGIDFRIPGLATPPDFGAFGSTYDDSKLVSAPDRDWAIDVDERVLAEFVAAIDLSDGRQDLRNTSQALDGVTRDGFELRGSGEARVQTPLQDWWGFDFTATAELSVTDPGTSQSEVRVDYAVQDVVLHSALARVVLSLVADELRDVLERRGQATGAFVLLTPAVFGDDSEPSGELRVHDAFTGPGTLTLRGTGTAEDRSRQVIEFRPDELSFTAPCPGESSQTRSTRLTTRADRHPLQICRVELEGDDADFEIELGRTGSYVLDPGGSERYQIRYKGGGDNHDAVLVAVTNAGVHRVPVRALLADAWLEGVPTALTLDSSQRDLDCANLTLDEVAEGFTVSNPGQGAVRICDVEVRNVTGGRWRVDGLAPGQLLESLRSTDVTVTYIASELDSWQQAELSIVTPAGSFHVALDGRVTTATDDGISPPPDIIDVFGFGGDQACFEIDHIEKVINNWEVLYEFVEEVWRRDPPRCCPEPIQPQCLCEDFLELGVSGLAAGARFRLRLEGEEVTELLDPRTTSSILLPFPQEGAARLDFEPLGHGPGRVRFRARRWQLTRLARHEVEGPLRDLAVIDERTVTLEDSGLLRLHEVGSDGSVESVAVLEVGGHATHLVPLGRMVVLADEESGLRIGELSGDVFRQVATHEAPAGRMLIALPEVGNRSPAMLLTADTTRIHLLDVRDSTQLRTVAEARTAIKPMTASVDGSVALVGGEKGVEAFALGRRGVLRSLGVLEHPQVVTVVGNAERFYAVDRRGAVRVAGVTRNGIETLGRIGGFKHGYDVLPAGPAHQLGRRFVARGLDHAGFNVVQFSPIRMRVLQ